MRAVVVGRPAWIAAAVVAVFAIVLAWVGIHVTTFSLDETLFHQSAVRYGSGLPETFLHDSAARATSRLYALLLAPLFAALDGDVAIRAAKAVNVLLWCSVAVPVFKLGRSMLSPARAAIGAVLAVVVPWASLTTVLFTESLALAAFAWFTWAAFEALRAPCWWRDLRVVILFGVAIGARVQLAPVLAGYVVLVAWALWEQTRGGAWWWRTGAVARKVKSYPFTTIVVLIGGPLLVLFLIHAIGPGPQALLGGYGTSSRATWVIDVWPMIAAEVVAIGFGLGIVVPILAATWYAQPPTYAGPGRLYARTTLVITAAVMVATGFVQGGFWGDATEERYWIYGAIFLWPAALASVTERRPQPRQLAVAACVFVVSAMLMGAVRSPDSEGTFLAPVLFTLAAVFVSGLPPVTAVPRDAVGLAALVGAGGAFATLRWLPWLRRHWLLAGAAALQLFFTAYPLLATLGVVAGGVADRTAGSPDRLGWIDRHARGEVGWLLSEPRADPATLTVWQQVTTFWNDQPRLRLGIEGSTPGPDTSPIDVLPLLPVAVNASNGALRGPLPAEVVAFRGSPYVQIAGARLVARSPMFVQLELLSLPPQPRLLLQTTGLGPAEAIPVPSAPAIVSVWPRTPRASLVLTVAAGAAPATVSAGRHKLVLAAGKAASMTVPVLGPRSRVRLSAAGTARLVTLEVRP